MSCAGSERPENSEVFDCRNMGDVLGKECKKDENSFAHLTDDVLRENADGAVNSGEGSDSDSDKVFVIFFFKCTFIKNSNSHAVLTRSSININTDIMIVFLEKI